MKAGTAHRGTVRLAVAATLLTALVVAAAGQARPRPPYVLGVSNTLVGNGWREELICSIKAQALASGKVSKVIVANRNGRPAEQIADIRTLIAAGANAIVVYPSSPDALNPVIAEAGSRGIKVVAVDRRVTAPQAYAATTDQVAYGRVGAAWLFKRLGGKGNVVEMRGIAGAPADTERHTGFLQALKRYPGIKVVKSTFTGWEFASGGRQMLELLRSGVRVDGVWTSGVDYTVTDAFATAQKPLVPIVGADTNAFLRQQLTLKGWRSAAVTNPAAIGAVGAAMALQLLEGKPVSKWVRLAPELWDNGTAAGMARIRANYSASRPPTYSARLQIKPWTTYSNAQLFDCKGP